MAKVKVLSADKAEQRRVLIKSLVEIARAWTHATSVEEYVGQGNALVLTVNELEQHEERHGTTPWSNILQ